jgi:beta-lactamase class A
MALCLTGCFIMSPQTKTTLESYTLDYSTPTDPALQAQLERIDADLRHQFDMTPEQTAVGVLDLRTLRLAMIHSDRIEYAASVPKIAILLAYFQLHPDAATNLSPQTRHELGLMIKQSSNEMAAKYSQALGLAAIRQVLDSYAFYDPAHGGGIWVGKHYGKDSERVGDPVGHHSHAATVRQLLRYYLLLEQGRLGSIESSQTMREIFGSPDIPPLNDRFVKGLEGRGVEILRKSGWWEDWFHDTAVITGPGRHFILVALTHHPKGDRYLEALAKAVDELMLEKAVEPANHANGR